MRKAILFLAAILLLANCFAAPVTIDDTQMTLLSNTGECLSDCEAWIEWDLTGAGKDYATPNKYSDSWKIDFAKKAIETPNLLNWGIEVWTENDINIIDYCQEEQQYKIDKTELDPRESCEFLGCKDTGTECDCTKTIEIECGSHLTKKWQKDSKT